MLHCSQPTAKNAQLPFVVEIIGTNIAILYGMQCVFPPTFLDIISLMVEEMQCKISKTVNADVGNYSLSLTHSYSSGDGQH